MVTLKTCIACGAAKDISCFNQKQSKCKDCIKIYKKQYYIDNKEGIQKQSKEYYIINKENISTNAAQYYIDNKEQILTQQKQYRNNNPKVKNEYNKQYYTNNKETLQSKNRQRNRNNRNKINKHIKNRMENDPIFHMRKNISKSINKIIKRNGGFKNNQSIIKHLPYSIQELKDHLEALFEPWMTWSNYGTYNSRIWDDNDPTTWTWQLDHIIPQSNLPYTSMTDDNFKKCWALSNLRPLSAKQNVIDGASKARHQ